MAFNSADTAAFKKRLGFLRAASGQDDAHYL